MIQWPKWLGASVAALALAVVVGLAMTATVDTRISDAIFAIGGNAWPLPHAGWTRAAGYEGPKYILIAFALFLIVGLARPALLRRVRLERREAAYLLVCLGLVPATIGLLRSQSEIVCASQLVRYGGNVPDWLGHFTLARLAAGDDLHGCFPSGHASGGFALLALSMLDRKPEMRRALWLTAALLGSYMGTYQLLRGAHFASHVLASGLIAQIVVFLVAHCMLGERTLTLTGQATVPLVRPVQRRT